MFLHYMIQSYALGSPVVLVPYWVFVVMREAKKGLGIGAQSTGDGGDKNTRWLGPLSIGYPRHWGCLILRTQKRTRILIAFQTEEVG